MYLIKLNGHTAQHDTYDTAAVAWERIASAAEDGRSIEAELWQHERHEIDSSLFTVIPGECIIFRQCIAALTHP